MLYPIFFLVLISIAAGIKFLFLDPKKRISEFCRKARQAGYKVKEISYNPFNFYIINYFRQQEASLRVLKEQLKQYDLIVGNFLTKISIIANHPDIIKDFFNHTSKAQKDPSFVDLYKVLFGGGMVFAEGEEWKKKRRIMSSLFHFDFINQMYPQIVKQTDQQMKKIDMQISSHQNVDLLKSFYQIFSNVIMKAFFEADLTQYSVNGRPYHQFFLETIDQISLYITSLEQVLFGLTPFKYGLTKKARQLKKRVQICYGIATEIVDKQLEKLKKGQFTEKNLLTVLYQNNMFNQTNVYDPTKYSKEEFIGQFFVLFTAGTDTSSNTINLLFHYLSANKECLEKVRQQFEEVKFIDGPEKFKKTQWADAVINETLRIGGPASALFPRVTVQKMTAGGIEIPKDTYFIIFSIMNHYNEEYYKKPFEFRPQRWIQQNRKIRPYVFIPFSAGERNCIGQHLARMEIKTVLQKFITRYNFKNVNPIKMQYQFVFKTKSGQFQMQIKPEHK